MLPMGTQGMKFARGFWEHDQPTSLTLGFKPKLIAKSNFDLKSFIRQENGLGSSDYQKKESAPVVDGGSRWNPTQEQIGILEMLYSSGIRTPNAQQIERITAQLAKYGKIEGKNVFYWFQNHKARERQKQKRNSPTTPPEELSDGTPCKRRCKTWAFDHQLVNENCTADHDEEVENRTLKLFPLHPEGR